MFFKKVLVILSILFLIFCCFNVVSASDNITVDSNEQTLITDNDYTPDVSDNDASYIYNDEIRYGEPTNTSKFDKATSECCSFVIQEEGRTVYAFRQDAPLNGFGVEINVQNWNGLEVLKQEIDTTYDYFFHSIVTENGWVIGQGGSQYNSDNRAIEKIVGSMVVNNDISTDSLRRISNILYDYGYGHVVIKAPDGRYGISFFDHYITGVLHPGQYMIIPNEVEYYVKGNYKDFGSNPVDAIINICSYDDSGLNRRNLYTYDYCPHETANGVFYGVDVFATNDNGRNVGLDTSGIVTHFYYNGKYFPASSVPQNPGKIYAGSHIFENQFLGGSIELVDGDDYVASGMEANVHYRINHMVSERTVLINLPDNLDFVKVSVDLGSYNYNAQEHTLYWKIPAVNQAKNIILTVKPKAKGDYNIHANVVGFYETNDFTIHAIDYGAYISSADVEKYVGGPQRLNVYLKNSEGIPLVGDKVAISINGVTYYREVSSKGYASLALNLGSGEYDVTASYDGPVGKNQTKVKVKIKTTMSGNDIEKFYKNDTQYYASFLGTDGNPLKNSDVKFNINGVYYTRKTDENGVAKLNINLNPGKYIITAINSASGEMFSNNVIVKTVLIDNYDIVKYYKDSTQYSLKVLDGQGNPLKGAEVSLNINGVIYKRTSDENGIVKLNINLAPGDYIVTASYNGLSVSNNVQILTRLITGDLSMQYRDGSTFTATVLNEDGRFAPGEVVTFNINGVFYNRTTDDDGIAMLNINLDPGEYIITSYWNDYAVSNKIKISS